MRQSSLNLVDCKTPFVSVENYVALTMASIASPIAKTAYDAIQAKRSAVHVGYTPIVVDNEDVYRDLLERISMDNNNNNNNNKSKVKRQIPLINAGYAIRVLSISHIIYNFLLFHRHKQTPKMQIVLLGCGLDVIGLWSYSMGKKLGIENIQLIEVDTNEVCTIKQDILTRQGLVVVPPHVSTERSSSSSSSSSSSTDIEGDGIFQGKIAIQGSMEPSTTTSCTHNYTLVSGDLCNIPKVSDSLLSVVDTSIPSLVLSELVLTYLPPSESEELLKWCTASSGLYTAPNSVFVALEPLGTGGDGDHFDDSVVEGYKRDYCQKFNAKLQRGRASKSAVSSSNDPSSTSEQQHTASTSFYPLGFSNKAVEQLFVECGFDVAHGTCLGDVAIHAMETVQRIRGGNTRVTLESPEIFDEHAALTLHLRSYNLTCAFSKGTDCLLRRFLCNYYFGSSGMGYCEPPPHIIEGFGNGTTVSLAVLQKEDQIQVRTLFTKEYEHLFEEYPAVRKMSKTALKTDLAINNSDIEEEGSGSDGSIATRYRELGGIFVVAVRYDQTSKEHRQVLGCVGVRPGYTKDPSDDLNSPLEIFRLVVDANYRGRGIGSELLRYVERFAEKKGHKSLVATTPAILTAANSLYQKCGFDVSEEVTMGSLVMRTLAKKL